MDKLTLNPHHKVAVGSTSTTDMEGKEDMKSEVVVKEEVCTDPEDTNMEGEHASEPLTGEEEDNESKTRSKMETQDELTLEIKRSKYSSPLNSLPNPNNSLEHHCLICYKMLVDIEATGGTSHTSTGADVLHGNLNVMVIMKNLLRVPSKDLETCLRHCGNPTNWLRICAECQPLIQNALSLNGKLMEVSKQLDKSRELIVERMRDSLGRNNEAFGSSSKCLTCDTDGCRGHENYLTDKIRKFVSKKNYPVTTNLYEEGDQEAKDKVRLATATLALQNTVLGKVATPLPTGICVEDNMSCSWCDSDDDNAVPEIANASDECNRVSEAPNNDDTPSSFLLNLGTKDMLTPITIADSMVQSSTTDFSTKTYHCSACPNLPLPDGMNFNKFLCHLTFHTRFPYRCSECKLFFPMNKATRKHHWKVCHKGVTPSREPFQIVLIRPVNMWNCFYCNDIFSTEEDREDHFMREHKSNHTSISKQYVCFHCPRMFYNKNERRLHIVIDQCSSANIYNCPVCEEAFMQKTVKGIKYLDESALYQHIDDEHADQIPTYKLKACELCGLVFQGVPNQFPGFVTHKQSHCNFTAVSFQAFAQTSLLNQNTSSIQQENIRQPPLILRKIKDRKARLPPGSQTHAKGPPLSMTSVTDNSTRVNSSSTLTTASQFLKARAVSSIPHEPSGSGSPVNRHNIKNMPKPIIPFIFGKAIKKVKKTTISSAAQAQVKLSSVSTRLIKPEGVLFMSPSTSTKAVVKVQAKTVSAPEIPKRPTIYSCTTCPHLQPKTLYDFLTHIAFHQKRPNRCVECLVYLPKNEATIAEHWSQFHNGSDKFPHCTEVAFNLGNIWNCRKCTEKFPSIEEQFSHERKAHQMCIKDVEGEYKCVTCSRNLHSIEEWQLHRAVEHPQIAEMSCFYCDKTFIFQTKEGIDLCNIMERLNHMMDKHPRNQIRPTDPCQLCGIDFEGTRELKDHLIKVHSIPEDKLHPCPIPLCTFARRRSYQLRKHIESVHTTQNYMCDNCGWSGKKVQQFYKHQFKIHGIVPEDFTLLTCEFEGCSFQALWKHDIKKHALVHLPEKERPLKCVVCGKGFYNRKHFAEHQEIHANKETRPYQCEICGNSFAVKNYLYIHKRLSHQGRFFPSTHKKKPKRATSKRLSKTKKYSETHAAAAATGSDVVSLQEDHGLSDELLTTSTVAAATFNVSLPD